MKKITGETYADDLVQPLYELLQEQNNFVVNAICKRIKEIGTLGPKDAHELKSALEYAGLDLPAVEKALKEYNDMSLQQIDAIFDSVAKDNVDFAESYYKAKKLPVIPYGKNPTLTALVEASKRKVKEEFLNYSKTTAFFTDETQRSIKQQYLKMINKAVLEIQTGTFDYNTAMRNSIKEMAKSGLRIRSSTPNTDVVKYKSGLKRRLDTAARMNALEGVRQLNADIQEQIGKEFGADGVEWSAHGLCATDHQPYQGRQFTKKEHEEINSKLKRPVGTLNCRHMVFQIIMGINEPNFSKSELSKINKESNREVKYNVVLNGEKVEKSATKYQCTQIQRQKETKIRYLQEEQMALKSSGDVLGAKQTQKRINELFSDYEEFSRRAGLTPKPARAKVQGYKKIRLK